MIGLEPLEVFEIEVAGEEYGAKKYREIILDILQDLGLVRAIGRLYVYVNIKYPLFAMYGILRGKQPPLRVSDIGDVTQTKDGYQIKISDEEHMANLLNVLSETYGRERILQPDRDVVVIESVEPPNNLVVADVESEFRQDLIDALIRITPEGFRNRRNIIKEDSFFFIASDENLSPEWITEASESIRRMQNA